MSKKLIRITHEENAHLLEMVGTDKTLTLSFGPSGVFVYEKTEPWALKELARLRGIDIMEEKDGV